MQSVSLKKIGLTYVSDTEPGIRRLKKGKGFCYRLPDGRLLDDDAVRQRIRSLGLPPAYDNVWICLDEHGHLQATGYDARGRKQYRYHSDWQAFRSLGKFHQLIAFGRALPRIRRKVAKDLLAGPHQASGTLAALVTLLDATHLRVGNRAYARDNGTYGATTLLKRHLRFGDDGMELSFKAKGGKRVRRRLRHPRLQRILEEIADLPGRTLFGWRGEDGAFHAIDSGRLNAYLADIASQEVSAKTFRTWGGTLAAFNSAVAVLKNGKSPTIRSMCEAAAETLHNTPAICRSSYVHPAVLDLAENPGLLGFGEAPARAVSASVRGLRADENRLLAYLSAVDKKS